MNGSNDLLAAAIIFAIFWLVSYRNLSREHYRRGYNQAIKDHHLQHRRLLHHLSFCVKAMGDWGSWGDGIPEEFWPEYQEAKGLCEALQIRESVKEEVRTW